MTPEVLNVIESFDLDFHLGNATKYVLHNSKNPNIPSLRRARAHITRKLALIGETRGFPAAHDAKDRAKTRFKAIAEDIAADPDANVCSVLQGVFVQGFQAAYEHLVLPFDE